VVVDVTTIEDVPVPRYRTEEVMVNPAITAAITPSLATAVRPNIVSPALAAGAANISLRF